MHMSNYFHANNDFYHLMITFANSLNIGPDLDPNGYSIALIVFLKEIKYLNKSFFGKKNQF